MTICYTPTSPHIAYAVHGTGAETLIVIPGWVSHLVFDWETPETRAFHERLAATRATHEERGDTGRDPRRKIEDTAARLS